MLLAVTAATVRGAATTVRGAAAMGSGEGVFGAPIMARVAYVALPVPRLVCVEVVELLRPALRDRSGVSVMRIIAVVDVAIKAVMAVKPGTSSNEQPASEPIRPIVAVGRTVIWGIVEVAVGAHRRHSNVNGNLSRRHGCGAQQSSSESRENKSFRVGHDSSVGLSLRVSK
jgi:hypothetical protein